LFIISHKTRHPFAGPAYDLHQSARDWLAAHDFYDRWISPDRVFFELTKKEKLARISQQGCTVFIDDLPEIFADADFPTDVRKILYDSANRLSNAVAEGLVRLKSWQDIHEHVLSLA
jgi:hypothetical protein